MVDFTESGVLTTASNLLFAGGREGIFFALDARTGERLWHVNLGGPSASGPSDTPWTANSTSSALLRARCLCSVCRTRVAHPCNLTSSIGCLSNCAELKSALQGGF